MNDFILKYGSLKEPLLKNQSFKLGFDNLMSIQGGEILCDEKSLLDPNSRLSISIQDDFTCITNSRIHNVGSLCKRYNFVKRNDSNLIYNIYKLKGSDFFKYIDGPFSVIIIDHNSNTLHAFSDHFSSKPIFFYKGDDVIFFSSSINLLRKITDNNKIDKEILIDYLISGVPRTQRTIYKDIDVVPVNSHIVIYDNILSVRKYRSFKAHPTNDSLDTIKKAIKKIMFKVVGDELLRSNAEIAFTLSGGLDSSSLLCTANEINSKEKKNKLSSHSALFNDLSDDQKKKTDERKYMTDVIKSTEIESFNYAFSGKGSLNIIDQLVDTEEPAMGPNLYINFKILEELQNKKIDVLYEGIGGDSAISHGHGLFYKLGRELKFIKLFDQYRKHCLNKEVKFSYINCIKTFVIKPRIPEKILKKRYKEDENRNDYFNINNFLKDEYKLDVGDRFEKIHGYHPALASSFKYTSYFYEELSTNDLFEPYASRMSYHIGKKFGIEIIFPFNDIRIREYCMNVPYELKMHDGIDRYYFRESMRQVIPKSVRKRLWKSDISPIFLNEIKKLGLNELIDLIFKDNHYFEKLLDKKKIELMYKKFQESGDQKFATTFYKYIYLSLWLKKNII